MKKALFLAISLVLSVVMAAQEVKDRDWANFARFSEANAAEDAQHPLAVLMGDSITQVWAGQDGEWLQAHGFVGRGISGQITSQMLVRFRADVIDLAPRYVVILAGINDIARNNGFIEVKDIFGNIVSMCELAVSNGIRPVLCALTPANAIGWRKDLGDPTPLILQLNDLLRAYAQEMDYPFVDYYTPMVGEGGAMQESYARDAVHPSLEGYHKMEEILLSTIGCRACQDGKVGFHERYTLEEVVVLSRHNIRSPLSEKGSVLSRITPYEWFEWTSAPSELSRKGTILEAQMGKFFGEWMEREGLWEHNAVPAGGEVRFYSNSLQRTIATARSFAGAFLPMADIPIEHHCAVGTPDPVFAPTINTDTEAFRAEAQRAVEAMGGREAAKAVSPQLSFLEQVIDIRHSPAAANDTLGFRTDDTQFFFVKDKEPSMTGGLKLAILASDALTLQYYEEPDLRKAGFGRKLSREEWGRIAAVTDWYEELLFGVPVVAKDVARPLLEVMLAELETEERKFSFLCGHDSNLKSVLAALRTEPYSLEDAVEKQTPIGSKLVICKWRGADGRLYADLRFVYASANQLRQMPILDLDTPPSFCPIRLQDLEANSDGLYRLEDLTGRFRETVGQ